MLPSSTQPLFTRRRFLQLSGLSAAGVALYSGEYERHHLEITHRDIDLARLPAAFDGLRIAQISDIHYDEFTEPYYVRDVVAQVNRLAPDLVLLTGDYVSEGPLPHRFAAARSYPCAEILSGIQCRQRWCVLGNHDAAVGAAMVTDALESHGLPVLANSYVPFERNGARLWIAGVKDVFRGDDYLPNAVPHKIMSTGEPVILMAHEPDFADDVVRRGGVDLMVSGHTHGGQIRVPLIGAVYTPPLGRKYIEGLFHLPNGMQLYVNRGIGAVGVPFRFDCRPELTLMTLHGPKNA